MSFLDASLDQDQEVVAETTEMTVIADTTEEEIIPVQDLILAGVVETTAMTDADHQGLTQDAVATEEVLLIPAKIADATTITALLMIKRLACLLIEANQATIRPMVAMISERFYLSLVAYFKEMIEEDHSGQSISNYFINSITKSILSIFLIKSK